MQHWAPLFYLILRGSYVGSCCVQLVLLPLKWRYQTLYICVHQYPDNFATSTSNEICVTIVRMINMTCSLFCQPKSKDTEISTLLTQSIPVFMPSWYFKWDLQSHLHWISTLSTALQLLGRCLLWAHRKFFLYTFKISLQVSSEYLVDVLSHLLRPASPR